MLHASLPLRSILQAGLHPLRCLGLQASQQPPCVTSRTASSSSPTSLQHGRVPVLSADSAWLVPGHVMVRCDNCESAQLVELEGEDGIAGFMCEEATEEQREAGSGCGVVVTQEEMRERRRAEGRPAGKPRPQQRRAAALLQSDDDEDEEQRAAAVGVSAPRNKENVSVNVPGKPSSSSGRRSLHRAAACCLPLAPASSSSSSSSSALSSYSASFRSKLKQQAASRLSSSSFDLDDHADDDVAALNSAALRAGGTMQLQRASVMQLLSVKGDENCVADKYRRAFVRPRAGAQPPSREAQQLMAKEKWGRRLGVRVRGYGLLGQPVKPLLVLPIPVEPPRVELKVDSEADAAAVRRKDGFEPLVVWTQAQLTDEDRQRHPGRQWSESIEVPPCVARFLRPHQRDGVQFMAECVLGLRRFQGSGAILADDMGLGKSLQSVALLYTLLTQGFEQGRPACRRVVVVTPTSLVANWGKELHKWLQDRVKAVAISESTRDDVVQAVAGFLHPRSTAPVLIISYDTFRLHCSLFMKAPAEGCCDLLICDEAHRLKNSKTATYAALDALPCQRRVLLSGTPLQNNLDEFFAMVSFTNRAVLGDRRMFRRYYEQPILTGREPLADRAEQQEGLQRSAELSAIVNQFVLRRTNTLLSAHLPPKVMQVVCCRPTALQVRLYDHMLKSKEVRRVVRGEDGSSSSRADALPLINALKSLCNHPKIVYDSLQGRAASKEEGEGGGSGKAVRRILSGSEQFFRDSGFERNPTAASWSGKMNVLEKLLSAVRRTTDDRVVIVAVWTSALDVMEAMCRLNRWPFLRLDGATAMKKRQRLVDELSDRQRDTFCFLLSSKAGGCGLNLIGANRLVLFDPDWNPAVDKQAAARIWRDGQAKRCFIYRLLTTGSIEEKVYQRQLSKEGLADVLGGGMNEAACTQDELRELFQRRSGESASDTHDHLQCDCLDGIMTSEDEAREKRDLLKAMEEEKERQRQQQDSQQKDGQQQEEEKEDGAALEVIDAEQPLGSPPASDSESADDDDDGFVVEDGSESEGDYDAPSRSSAAKGGKKARKAKRGERRRSLKTSLVLDPLLLSSITKAMIGQRGAPPEDELVNWAHHITAMSAPDPLLRQAVQGMSRTRDGQQFVSFVFSCEVKGKQIGAVTGPAGEPQQEEHSDEEETAETREFAQYSARCSLPPVVKERTAGLSISADEALQKHHKMIEEHEKRRRKRLGQQDADDGDAAPGGRERRHSTRLTHRSSLSEDALANQQLEGAGGGGGADGGAGGDARRGRKRAVAELELEDALSKVDPADAAAIKLAMQEEEPDAGRKRGRQSGAAAQKKAAERQQEVEQEEEEAEEEEEEEAGDEEEEEGAAGQPAARDAGQQQVEEEEEDGSDDVIDLSKLPAVAARPPAHKDVKMKAAKKEERRRQQEDDDEEEEEYEEEGEAEEEDEGDDDSSVEVMELERQKPKAKETTTAGRAEDRRYAIKPSPAAAAPAAKQTSSRQPVKHLPPVPPARAAPPAAAAAAAATKQMTEDDPDEFF